MQMEHKYTAEEIAANTKAHIQACHERSNNGQTIAQHVTELFAYHCGEIMTSQYLNAFALNVPGGPSVFVTIKIVSRSADGNIGWDQVEVNGVRVGNRHAARDEYARLCMPVLTAAFAAK